jgi:4-diphosphocytidyl-2-C-methyl-D-erythritol kinase
MLCLAPAKINLTLDVLGRRPDGYHELRSVMLAVSLADELDLEPAPDLSLEVVVEGRGPAPHAEVPAGPRNLVWRAAEELRLQGGYTGGARLRLRKRIPAAAGLGGGSSDAAAALRGLNALWGLGLSRARLTEVAAAVGSDVPFFLARGAALVSGRGEGVEPLVLAQRVAELPLVLARPPLAVATAQVFAALTPDHYTSGQATAALVATLTAPGPSPSPRDWPLHNALQETTCRLYPVVEEVLAALQATGALAVLMSGSGPTCAGIYATPGDAAAAAARMGSLGWEAWAVRSMLHGHDA